VRKLKSGGIEFVFERLLKIQKGDYLGGLNNSLSDENLRLATGKPGRVRTGRLKEKKSTYSPLRSKSAENGHRWGGLLAVTKVLRSAPAFRRCRF